LKYGTTADQRYDVSNTNTGLSALVAASANYALFQFDHNVEDDCEFFSYRGAGHILVPEVYFLALIALGISLSTVILFQLVWW
jgi:hypothetical protein